MYFKEVEVKDKKTIDNFVLDTNYGTCEFAFANLFCLRKKYGTEICVEDFLYIRQTTKSNPEAFYYFMPIGGGDLKSAIENIEQDAKSHGKQFIFWGITEQMREKIESIFPNRFLFTTSRDWAEYVYLSERLIHLQGSDLKKRRNNLNIFMNKYGDSYSFNPIATEKDIDDAWQYHKKWFMQNVNKNEEADSLELENKIIREAFDNWNELNLKGAIVKLDSETVGFTYGAKTYLNMFDVHVEKADYTKNGIYQAINRDFAKYACESILYVNREEDLGIEGLRVSKMAYKPFKLLAKYTGVHNN